MMIASNDLTSTLEPKHQWQTVHGVVDKNAMDKERRRGEIATSTEHNGKTCQNPNV